MLSVLVPRLTFERIAAESGRRARPGSFSALYLDQPLSRQLNLLRFALPGRKRVAALLGPESAALAPRLRSAVSRAGFELQMEQVAEEGDIVPALNRLLPGTDVLLALPDGLVFNRNTARPVLLTTYRHQRPVVGFSQAYVTAGALAAVFSTPAQMGAPDGRVPAGPAGGTGDPGGAPVPELLQRRRQSQRGPFPGTGPAGRGCAAGSPGKGGGGRMMQHLYLRLVGSIRQRALWLALLPAVLVATALASYFSITGMGELDEELRRRGHTIVQYLAPASEYGLISGNRPSLQALVQAAMQQPDVRAAVVTDFQGRVLAISGRTQLPVRLAEQAGDLVGLLASSHDTLGFVAPVRRSQLDIDDFLSLEPMPAPAPRQRPPGLGLCGTVQRRPAGAQVGPAAAYPADPDGRPGGPAPTWPCAWPVPCPVPWGAC